MPIISNPTSSASTVKIKEDSELEVDLKTVADYYHKEDTPTREQQIRYWKRLKYYWNNFSQVYWDGQSNAYKIWGQDSSNSGNDQSYYDRPVNVFKSFLETIIAALSVQVPAVSCIPDDADNPNDLSTAKAGDIISKQIYRHNDVIMLWIKALYVYCTEGMIACYTYTDTDKKYGTFTQKNYVEEDKEDFFCSSCNEPLDEELVIQSRLLRDQLENEYDPQPDSVPLQDSLGLDGNPENNDEHNLLCPNCAVAIDPSLQKRTLKVKRFTGATTQPKSRICLEVYGGLYVKVANYARKQSDTPYLELAYEQNFATVLEAIPSLWDKMPAGGWDNQGVRDTYEQYSRLNVQYRGTYPEDTVTVRNMWLRPAAFNAIKDKERADKLKRKFPNGCKVVLVNDIVAEYCDENLDDHWTLTENPQSDYLTFEPLGEVLTNIQDIVNDLISLTIQTIEHGIVQTWVDPAVVNVDAYGQLESEPGTITATKPVSGSKSIKDAFHSTTSASLSPEVFAFYRIVNELGQFVSGALPSVFGGAMPGAGETAAAYEQSRAMALQRLQTPWKMLTIWWKQIFGKAIPAYMDMLQEDERFVEKNEQGKFVNVFIRKSEMYGKIGDVELEASDQLPVSDEQQKRIIMELMSLNNAEVFNALTAPENLPFIRKIVRIPEFRMPGEDDRQKQYEEIDRLLNEEPILAPPDEMAMQEAVAIGEKIKPVETPSVPIDPIIDNNQIEWEIVRGWAVSEAGRLAKVENEAGYKNVILHGLQHKTELDKQMAMQAATQQLAEGSHKSENKTPSGQKKETKEPVNNNGNQ
jgi:hypothetical protein